MSARGAARGARGFTLAEVMIALASLGMALTMLVRSIAGNIGSAQEAMYMGIVADLGRGKMYDIEEHLAQEGFKDTEEHEEGVFDDEGWPGIKWEYKVIPVELPSFDQLQAMAQGRDANRGSASGSNHGSASSAGSGEPPSSFQDSALGGMLSQLGGGFSGGSDDIDSKAGASFIQMYYQMVQETLKASIRKVTLTVKWDLMGVEKEMKTVVYLTDAPAMDKVLRGLGAQEASGSGSGSGRGSGSGSGRGSGAGSGTRPGGKGP